MVSRLEQLQAQRDQLTEKIQKLQQQARAKNRKIDTRRKILVGAIVMAMVERGEWSEEKYRTMLDQYLDRDRDRKLFDLPEREE